MIAALNTDAVGTSIGGCSTVTNTPRHTPGVEFVAADGSVNLITGCQLPAEASAELFSRTGRTHLLEVQLGADYRPL